jgi:rubrerythrin
MAPLLLPTILEASNRRERTMDGKTHENLLAALHGEAFAYARYRLFAQAARKRGDNTLASMFDGIAAVELDEHFAELAELAGLAGTDVDNLRTALHDENDEVEALYPEFARQARSAGEHAVAARFEEMAEDELEHEKTLEQVLGRLEVPA